MRFSHRSNKKALKRFDGDLGRSWARGKSSAIIDVVLYRAQFSYNSVLIRYFGEQNYRLLR